MPNFRDSLLEQQMLLRKKLDAISTLLEQQNALPTEPRKRKSMSLAARKAHGERMKAYWAARRAGNKKAPNTKR